MLFITIITLFILLSAIIFIIADIYKKQCHEVITVEDQAGNIVGDHICYKRKYHKGKHKCSCGKQW